MHGAPGDPSTRMYPPPLTLIMPGSRPRLMFLPPLFILSMAGISLVRGLRSHTFLVLSRY